MPASLCVISKIKTEMVLQPVRQKRANIRRQDNIPVIFNGLNTGDKHCSTDWDLSKAGCKQCQCSFPFKMEVNKICQKFRILKDFDY